MASERYDIIKINLIALEARVFESKSIKDFNCINLTRTLTSKGSRINCKSLFFQPFSSIPDDITRTYLVKSLEGISLQERVSNEPSSIMNENVL